jgi:hypothetical protein
MTFETFLDKKMKGDFPSDYNVLNDTNLQNLFLH